MTHEPFLFAGKWSWSTTGNDIPHYPEDLPGALFNALAGGELQGKTRYYPTREEALAALWEAQSKRKKATRPSRK